MEWGLGDRAVATKPREGPRFARRPAVRPPSLRPLSADPSRLPVCGALATRSMLKDLPKRTMREKLEAVHDAQGKFMEDHTKPRGW